MRVEKIGDATLYLGDCLEILPTVLIASVVHAVVTDPPYGVSGASNSKTSGGKNNYISFVDSPKYVRDVAACVVRQCIGVVRGVVVTPGNRCLGLYPNPDAFGAVYQPASVGLQPWGRADAQPILYYGKSPHGGKGLPSQKCSFQSTSASDKNGHPCPKPIKLIEQLVTSASLLGETIFDPFMGSGTTGVACANLGRKFIGIEIEPKYFDIACERIDAAYAQKRLFV